MGRDDGRLRISIFYFASSIIELNRLTLAPAARPGKVKFEIVALGIEHVDRVAAVALDAAMVFAQFFGRLQRVVVILPGHVESLVKNTVLFQGVALHGTGAFEATDIVGAAAQAVKFLKDTANRQGIGIIRIAADAT